MKEKQPREVYFNINKTKWSKENWKNFPISQQPEYIDTELLNEITDKVSFDSIF